MRCSTIGCSAFSSMQLAGDFVPTVIDNNYHCHYCYVGGSEGLEVLMSERRVSDSCSSRLG